MKIDELKNVTVIGAGAMGHGIAQVALMSGYDVTLCDIKDEFVQRGKQRILESLDKLCRKGKVEQAVVDIITDNQNNGKATGLGEVGSRLLKRYPDFDVRSYGTNQLTKLLGEFASVQVIKDGNSVMVELTESSCRGRCIAGRGRAVAGRAGG